MKKLTLLILLLFIPLIMGATVPWSTGPCGDGNDAYVKLLLHCNGVNGSTTFTDSSTSGKTVTAGGTPNIATISTARSRYGGASGLFVGGGSYSLGWAGSCLYLADSDDWFLGTGDFTIDFWVMFTELPTTDTDGHDYAFIFSQNDSDTHQTGLALHNVANLYYWTFYTTDTTATTLFSTLTTISINTWYHVEIDRSGNDFYLFQNGNQLATTNNSVSIPDRAARMFIGTYGRSGAEYADNFIGYLDEVRWSKGIARHTASFKPYSCEYQ